jgi:ferredoxin
MHCEEPACVSACLVGALQKSPEGPVTWNEKVCIGCRYCITACPFYVPAFEYSSAFDPKIQKCFMCTEDHKWHCSSMRRSLSGGGDYIWQEGQTLKLAKSRIWGEPDKYIDHVYGEREAGGQDGCTYPSPVLKT